MPPKGWKKSYEHETESDASPLENFILLVARVPDETFFDMAAKSGLPRDEARALCEAFRKLKG
jgi:hypothetical protein